MYLYLKISYKSSYAIAFYRFTVPLVEMIQIGDCIYDKQGVLIRRVGFGSNTSDAQQCSARETADTDTSKTDNAQKNIKTKDVTKGLISKSATVAPSLLEQQQRQLQQVLRTSDADGVAWLCSETASKGHSVLVFASVRILKHCEFQSAHDGFDSEAHCFRSFLSFASLCSCAE